MELYIKFFFIFVIGTVFGSYINATALRFSQYIEKWYDEVDEKNYGFFENLIGELKLLKKTIYPIRSECPACKRQLKWYHNIPVVSYLFLKGKCFYCKTKIPIIYLFSELFLGVISVYLYYHLTLIDMSLIPTISLFIATYILYFGIVVDIKTRFIPDISIYFSAPFFLIFSLYYNNFNFQYIIQILGIGIVGYNIIKYLTIFIYKKTGKIYIGLADIKLLVIFGSVLGGIKILYLLFLASYISLPFFIINYIRKKETVLDFGIYLYIAFYIVLFYYQDIYNFLIQ